LIFAHFHLPNERLSWARIMGVLLGVLGVGVGLQRVVGTLPVRALGAATAALGVFILTQ
jgi:hypothetical protein